MVKKFATGMHESWLYNPTTSTKLSILSWLSCPWILKFSYPFILQFLVILRPIRTWKDGEIITVLVLPRVTLTEKILIWDYFCKIWWDTIKYRRRSRTKDHWLHSGNRSQATCWISGNYSRQSFQAWRSPGCIAVVSKPDGSSKSTWVPDEN